MSAESDTAISVGKRLRDPGEDLAPSSHNLLLTAQHLGTSGPEPYMQCESPQVIHLIYF
jgi:hypothetical protein